MNMQNYLRDTKVLFSLSLPILVTQLIHTLVGFFDTVMAGRVSATDLAAVALASSVWIPLTLTIYGVFISLAAIVSRYQGQNESEKVSIITIQGVWLALLLSLILIISFVFALPFIESKLTIDAKLAALTIDYLFYVVWGAPGYFVFMALRNFTEGLSFTKPTMVISIIGLLLNIPLNYIFIYGEFGFNAYGGAGCGIATAIVYSMMCLMMILYVTFAKSIKQYQLIKFIRHVEWQEIKHILIVGIPIALSLLFEVSLFSVVSILLAPYGPTIVAGHQVALNFTGLLFMIPLSLAMGVTIKVGFTLGENKPEAAKAFSRHAIITGLIIAIFTASFTYLLKTEIAEIYTHETDVITLAASLMLLACLYQFSDAVQVLSAGALRGYKDTKSILIVTFISYWIIGLSIGYYLATYNHFSQPLGPSGYWIGFILGLTSAAILLFTRLRTVQKRLELKTIERPLSRQSQHIDE